MNRPEKLSDRQTIIYEVDMLEYCYQRLITEKKPLKKLEGHALLECFLLHYRNLIEFFGKNKDKLRSDDLSVYRPQDWAGNLKIGEDQIKTLVAKEACEEYEGRDERGERRKDTISRYLQHCTKQRTESKDWPVEEMYDKILPSIEGFRHLLEDWQHVAIDDGKFVIGEAGASTATIRTFGSTEQNK